MSIVFIYPSDAGFNRNDADTFSEIGKARTFSWNGKNGGAALIRLIPQFFFSIVQVPRSKVVVFSGAGIHTFLPALIARIFRKPILVILHGSESWSVPAYHYGNLRGGFLKKATLFTAKSATKLLPVSNYILNPSGSFARELNISTLQDYQDIQDRCEVIYNQIDSAFWSFGEGDRDQNLFMAVVSGESQFSFKGLDLLLEVAAALPEFEFRIVGMDRPDNYSIPNNCTFLGRISQEALRDEYQRVSFMVHLSLIESFGLSVAEAMCCGCIPVVSNINMLAEFSEGRGISIDDRSSSSVKEALLKANRRSWSNQDRARCRQYIQEKFAPEKRKEHLRKVILDQSK